MTNKISALLIAGPTASGKSDLAINLASALNGVIVNADSMQVYRDLHILTARPSDSETRNTPHKLYGHVDGAHQYSTGKWLEDIAETLKEAEADGQLPIIVGGTGLYFKALLEGLVVLPDIPHDIRQKYRDMLVTMGSDILYAQLKERDPKLAARIAPADGQRIVRGLEVFEATGKSLSQWHEEEGGKPLLDMPTVFPIVVDRDREDIYARCDVRFDNMIEEGALEEVATLSARSLDPHLPVMKVIGVPQIMHYLAGDMSLEEAGEKVKTLTRRYAKRQLTWLRRNMIAWNKYSAQDSERILLDILPKLRKNG